MFLFFFFGGSTLLIDKKRQILEKILEKSREKKFVRLQG